MQTALNERIGFRGSLKSHKCVKVSMEQLANKCGSFECQSISVTTKTLSKLNFSFFKELCLQTSCMGS